MALVLFLLTIVINIVMAFEGEIKNCNECIRTGGRWCNQIEIEEHCMVNPPDDWCSGSQESLPTISESPVPGKIVNPVYVQSQLHIGNPTPQDITYESPVKLDVKISILNSTQTIDMDMNDMFIEVYESKSVCKGSKCITTITASPTNNFCSKNGGLHEYVHVRVAIGNLTEESIIKYSVSCACPCSLKVQKKSDACNGNGDLACGTCSCYNGWSGEFCGNKTTHCATKGGCPPVHQLGCQIEMNSTKCNNNGNFNCGKCECYRGWSGEFCDKIHCEDRRGDMQCNNPAMNDVECSGNGFCGPCDTCICYTDREGSQYFDEDNYCSDLCMVTNNCDACLLNNTIGECADCNVNINKIQYNESFINQRDNFNRKTWMRCNETIDGCLVTYYAMRDESGQIDIMIAEHCDYHIAQGVTNTKVPIIMGVLGIIAAVMAVAGVMAWKHFNTVPPLPLSDPEYQNIDAEDCTGMNPLYKSPMSSFKNPTYGKW